MALLGCDLFDISSFNMVATFATLDEATGVLAEILADHGPDTFDTLAMFTVYDDREDEILQGDELVELARQTREAP